MTLALRQMAMIGRNYNTWHFASILYEAPQNRNLWFMVQFGMVFGVAM